MRLSTRWQASRRLNLGLGRPGRLMPLYLVFVCLSIYHRERTGRRPRILQPQAFARSLFRKQAGLYIVLNMLVILSCEAL